MYGLSCLVFFLSGLYCHLPGRLELPLEQRLLLLLDGESLSLLSFLSQTFGFVFVGLIF